MNKATNLIKQQALVAAFLRGLLLWLMPEKLSI